MVDFISEVQEELRKDDYNRWLRKYGPFVGLLVVLIVAITGYIQWQDYQAKQIADETSYGFIETVRSIDQDKGVAIQEFKSLAEKSPEGYTWVSLKRAAELELESGNADKALIIYDEAAKVLTSERHSQLAQLKAGYIVTSQGDYDSAIKRLEPLTLKDQPYEYLARELLGFVHSKNGDIQSARSQFLYIERDVSAPPNLVKRAKQHLIVLNKGGAETIELQPTTVEPEKSMQSDVPTTSDTSGETPTETQDDD